jgi:PAS domain S-box-containing protein
MPAPGPGKEAEEHASAAEEGLREREERLALAIEAADIGTWDWDPRTGALQWSRRCKELFGLPEDARVDHEMWIRAIHPADRERVLGILKKASQPDSGGLWDIEYRTVGVTDHVER